MIRRLQLSYNLYVLFVVVDQYLSLTPFAGSGS